MASDLCAFPVKISEHILIDRALQNRKLWLLRWKSDNHYRRVVNDWRHLMVTNRNDHPLTSGKARARPHNVILVLLRVCSFYKPLSHHDFIFGNIFISFTLYISLLTCFILGFFGNFQSFIYSVLVSHLFSTFPVILQFTYFLFACLWHQFVIQWFT